MITSLPDGALQGVSLWSLYVPLLGVLPPKAQKHAVHVVVSVCMKGCMFLHVSLWPPALCQITAMISFSPQKWKAADIMHEWIYELISNPWCALKVWLSLFFFFFFELQFSLLSPSWDLLPGNTELFRQIKKKELICLNSKPLPAPVTAWKSHFLYLSTGVNLLIYFHNTSYYQLLVPWASLTVAVNL